MLKLTYTENGFYMERLAQSLEEWVMARVLLSLRAGTSLSVEPSTASFLLPADLPQLADLEMVVRQERVETIALSLCDAEYVEVSLHGTWMTSDLNGEEGVFVTAMGYAIEFFLYKLWFESQAYASVAQD
jgi:hypothetical protein